MSYLLHYVAFVAFFFGSGLGQECEGVGEAYHAGREDENNVILQSMQEVVDAGGTREINKNHELVHPMKEAAKAQLKVKKLKGHSFGKYLKAGMAVGTRKNKKKSSSTKTRKKIKASKIVSANRNAARMNALKISPRRRASMTKVAGHKPKKPAAMKVLNTAAAKVPRRRHTASPTTTGQARRRRTGVTRRRRTRRRRSEIHRRRRTEVRRRRRRRGPAKVDKNNLGITRRRRRARKHRRRRTTKVGERRRRRRGRRHRRRGTKTKPVHHVHVVINPIKITVNNGSTAKMTTTTKSSSGSKGHVHYIKVRASVIKKMLAKKLAKKKTR